MSATGTAVFTSVRTEGGLLPADLLRRVSLLDSDLPGMTPIDFGLAPGERIADAIVRSWNRLVPIWERFAGRLERLPSSDWSATDVTRDEWSKWLLEELDFTLLKRVDPVTIDNRDYPVSHRCEGIALHLVGARVDIEHRDVKGGRAPHSMLQEFLNRDDGHLWAIVTNGMRLRILRDSTSLTRQAFCEFDVEAIFSGQLYAEFALLWLTCHRTRFVADTPSACHLQRWSDTAQTEGVRALDDLRAGVEAAIEALGSGLLTPENAALRDQLRTGTLTAEEFKRQLLRLVYRLLFLLVAEARDHLGDPDAPADAKARYRASYSMARLVALARRQKGSRHTDLWAGLQVVFAALAGPGAPALGLVGLGSFLWSSDALPALDGAVIPNRALLEAVDRLTSFETGGVRRRVDYKNLGAEELGGVYESLLESHVDADLPSQIVTLDIAAGNERKTTGSYYTPSPLIRVLLDSALDPVLDEADQAPDPEAALLALKVLDPAVGSGHFLIAAANRIANRLASVRAGDTEPSPSELRHALREVISHCVYGIDVNPMSVELCKVSLWMESAEPGKPLSFLDHRIVLGNSLLGANPALIAAGVPDDALKALAGDDKAVVKAIKKRNALERGGQLTGDFSTHVDDDASVLADLLVNIDGLPSETAHEIGEKERRYAELLASHAAERLKLSADAWCAAIVNLKVRGEPQLTTGTVRLAAINPDRVPVDERTRIDDLTKAYGFVHLHVAFPDVFRVVSSGDQPENEVCGWSGGFDAVVGNPPWERVKLQEKEWFAVRDPAIASAPNAAARKRMISALIEERPELHSEFLGDSRKAEGESHLLRNGGRYPLSGRGDVNTYAVFAELMRNAICPIGRVGVVLPTGIATDETTRPFFADLVDNKSVVALYDFENRKKLFPGIDSRVKFSLLTLSGKNRPVADADFVFFALDVDDLEDVEKRVALTRADLWSLNPHTGSLPMLRSGRDLALCLKISRQVPPLVAPGPRNSETGWGFRYKELVHLAHAAEHLEPFEPPAVAGKLPVIEAKTCWFFDHRAADVVLSETAVVRQGQSRELSTSSHQDPQRVTSQRYSIAESWVAERLAGQWSARWMVGFRDITSSTNERTLVPVVVPFAGLAHTLPMGIVTHPNRPLLVSILSSYVADWCCRQRLAGLHLTMNVMNNVSCIGPEDLDKWQASLGGTVSNWLRPIVLELTYTAWDLAGFAVDLGHEKPPFRWDPDRREGLRAEVDALMFRLYGIERDDVDYIMNAFPIVKRKDEADYGEYRTKRLILERFDAMAAAESAGTKYVPALDPPPGDPSLCHPESTRPSWAQPAGAEGAS